MSEDEVSLRDLATSVWRSRRIAIACTLAGALIAGVAGFMTPNEYDASVLISPVSNNSSSRLGGSASQLGGLASLVGLNVGGDSNKAQSLAVLQSEELTQRYITENNLIPILYGQDSKLLKLGEGTHPTLWKAVKKFSRIRRVVDDKKSGLTTLTITWTDAALAAKWANDLVKLTNDELRGKAVQESEHHVAYLSEQAAKTDVQQVRLATYTILADEIKNLMLAKGPGDFALRVLDPATASERKSGPFRSLWVLAGMLIGFAAAVSYVFMRDVWTK
jgi:uncharacterized protein involved in exopolysaccharide biosynthesis